MPIWQLFLLGLAAVIAGSAITVFAFLVMMKGLQDMKIDPLEGVEIRR